MPPTAVWQPTLGALPLAEGPEGRCRFRVWAPRASRVEVELLGSSGTAEPRRAPLEPGGEGTFEAVVEGAGPGTRYRYRLEGPEGDASLPDPASRLQPEGVHGPSQVVGREFPWTDAGWSGLDPGDYVFYELHVGTFTPAGTFDAAIGELDRLRDLGVTAVELMPVSQFPGRRNWGYDGVFPYAVQESYGGPEGLKRFVDACHARALAVVLDVVYNHLGPEGNVLPSYGPYFTGRYHTPWGDALNFDGPESDPVRRFFLESALSWIADFHVDALRLDAVHAIIDLSERPFLQELGTALHELGEALGRRVHAFPESDINTLFFLRPAERGGCGLDAQWTDDFHHALHALLTGERSGYYADFGSLAQMARALSEGWVYQGEHSPHRRRRHGVPAAELGAERHVVFAQNHDQTGNRMLGDRLPALVPFEGLKLAASLVLLSPFLPLLFMGEEWGEPAPFLYFVDHQDPDLVRAVREGRRAEFAAFGWRAEPPDPGAEATFERSRIDPSLRERGEHGALYELYRELLRLRRSHPALAHRSKRDLGVNALDDARVLALHRWTREGSEAVALFHFGEGDAPVEVPELPVPAGRWRRVLDTAEERWAGPGSAIPEEVESTGRVSLRLAGRSAVLLAR
jgi:maltooligosyltrehalose trehalohydrolase